MVENIAKRKFPCLLQKPPAPIPHTLHPHQAVEAAAEDLPEQVKSTRPCAGVIMQLQNENAKHEMKTRLRRLEGQVRGVQSMLDDERDCREIIQQLSSIRSAVQSASAFFLREYTTGCVDHLDPADPQANKKMMDDLINLLAKAP